MRQPGVAAAGDARGLVPIVAEETATMSVQVLAHFIAKQPAHQVAEIVAIVVAAWLVRQDAAVPAK